MPGEDYVEYDASAGSVTTAVDKDNNTAGSGTLFTLTQTMSKDENKQSDSYNVTGKVPQVRSAVPTTRAGGTNCSVKELPITTLLSAM